MRLASPASVQLIWDAIIKAQSCGSQVKPVDFQRLFKFIDLQAKNEDRVKEDLERIVKDGLVTEFPVSGRDPVYTLPDASKGFEKGTKDWYCFHCHEGGSRGRSIGCSQCPRVYHFNVKCLPGHLESVNGEGTFVCPVCEDLNAGKNDPGLSKEDLNKLIGFSLDRLDEWAQRDDPLYSQADGQTWAKSSGRDAWQDEWRFDYLIYFPVDLTRMLAKARSGKYQSLEEYRVDADTFMHSIAIYFGKELVQGEAVPATVRRDIIQDIEGIKLCPDCFRRANEKPERWFCLPCSSPHEVIWAKQGQHPYWPAKVIKLEENSYDVRYFGGKHERYVVSQANTKPIDTPLEQLGITKKKRTKAWEEAYTELQEFRKLAVNTPSGPPPSRRTSESKGGKATPTGKQVLKRKAQLVEDEAVLTPVRCNSKKRKSVCEHKSMKDPDRAVETGEGPSVEPVAEITTKKSMQSSGSKSQVLSKVFAPELKSKEPQSDHSYSVKEPTSTTVARFTSAVEKARSGSVSKPKSAKSAGLKRQSQSPSEPQSPASPEPAKKRKTLSAPQPRLPLVQIKIRKSSSEPNPAKNQSPKASTFKSSPSTAPTETPSASATGSSSRILKSILASPARNTASSSSQKGPKKLVKFDFQRSKELTSVKVEKVAKSLTRYPLCFDNDDLKILRSFNQLLEGESHQTAKKDETSESAVSSSVKDSDEGASGVNERVIRLRAFHDELVEYIQRSKAKLAATTRAQLCVGCKKEAVFYCCWNTSYCSPDCQRIDWPDHKKVCRRPRGGGSSAGENGSESEKFVLSSRHLIKH